MTQIKRTTAGWYFCRMLSDMPVSSERMLNGHHVEYAGNGYYRVDGKGPHDLEAAIAKVSFYRKPSTEALAANATHMHQPSEADLDYAYGVHGGSIVGGPICQCSNPNVPGCPRHGHKIDCPF